MSGAPLGGEFSLIYKHFAQGFPDSADTRLAVGDDASLVLPPPQHELVQSIDTQVADVHFPANAPAHLIAQRALRCAASDLAAMGARPQGFHLALTLPEANDAWLSEFSRGLKEAAHCLNLALLGGDTTKGPVLVISIAVQGWVPEGQALRRHNAQVNDDIWLSGPVGSAALALPLVLADPSHDQGLAQSYYYPVVHSELGQALRGLAHSAQDVSDGLLQDAAHIARQSNVTLRFQVRDIPTPVPCLSHDWWTCVRGGDDYQLLFTTATHQREAMQRLQRQFPALACVGKVVSTQSEPVQLQDGDALLSLPEQSGYQHF